MAKIISTKCPVLSKKYYSQSLPGGPILEVIIGFYGYKPTDIICLEYEDGICNCSKEKCIYGSWKKLK